MLRFRALIIVFFTLSVSSHCFAQTFTETVKGVVFDEETQLPLGNVKIELVQKEHHWVAMSDRDGTFSFEKIPVGRVNLTFELPSYEVGDAMDLLVASGRETDVVIRLVRTSKILDEITINSQKIRGEALNRMATVSSYVLNVEETQKFAGSWDDPTRVATSYPGVIQLNSGFNSFTVRGNAPVGVLYRLEGIPILNPNHFAEIGSTGGFVTQFSTQLLTTSELFTSAFPAEFGNATTAVFDFKFRNGNKNKREHAARINIFGVDFATEGPFKKGGKASYLINYRYSSLGLLARALNFETIVPTYQDLSFNLNFPTEKFGTFKLFAIGGLSNLLISAQEDSTQWDGEENRIRRNLGSNSGAIGLVHYLSTSKKGYWHSVVSGSVGEYFNNASFLQNDLSFEDREISQYTDKRITFTTDYNHRFGRRHSNKSGIIATHIDHNYGQAIYSKPIDQLDTIGVTEGSSQIYQAFSQSKFVLSEKWESTVGVHFLHFALNNKLAIEPRVGLTYKPSARSIITLGYGLHSRVEDLSIYFAETLNDQEEIIQPNRNLGFLRSHQGVLRFARMLTSNLKLTAETYFQYLTNVPTDPNGTFSVQNLLREFPTFALDNTGEGRNYGLELSLRRFTKKGFYFLLTGALFQSEYKGGDGIWRNTEFNQRFSYNALVGKEIELKPKENKKRLLGLNANLRHSGGTWQNTIDEEQSSIYGWTRYDFDNPYNNRQPALVNFDFTLSLKGIHKNFTGEFSVQIKNVFNQRTVIGQEWDERIQSVKEIRDYGIIPVIGYKVWL